VNILTINVISRITVNASVIKDCLFLENIHDLSQNNNIKMIDEGHVNIYDTIANNAENNDILITDMDVSLSCK